MRELRWASSIGDLGVRLGARLAVGLGKTAHLEIGRHIRVSVQRGRMRRRDKRPKGRPFWKKGHLHYNWPRHTPPGPGAGKPAPKACPGPIVGPRA
jgi:hypothetical protein